MENCWHWRPSPQISDLQKQVYKVYWLHNQNIRCSINQELSLCIILTESPALYVLCRMCMGCQITISAAPFSLGAKAEQSSYSPPNFPISESLSPVRSPLFVNNPPGTASTQTRHWRRSRLCGWKFKVLPGSLDFLFLTTSKYSI